MLFVTALFSCSKQEQMIRVEVDEAMHTPLTKKLSDVVKSLEYVALETDSNCLVGNAFDVALFEKDIAVIGRGKILLFDRTSGKFKKEVLHRGRDPQGYSSTMAGYGMCAIEKTGDIFIKEWNKKISTYNVYTQERKGFSLMGNIKSVAYTSNESFVTTAFNFDGQHPIKMWRYDNYQCVDSIPNKWMFNLKSDAMAVIKSDEIFYRWNNRTFFKDATNDTVFAVTDVLTPVYIFQSDNLPEITLRERPENMAQKMKDMYCIHSLMEDGRHIYYTMGYQDKTYRLVYDKASGRGGVLNDGFENDLNGGVNLFPDHITEREEYVFVLNPAFMSEEELDECNLKEDDNPMIVIGRP